MMSDIMKKLCWPIGVAVVLGGCGAPAMPKEEAPAVLEAKAELGGSDFFEISDVRCEMEHYSDMATMTAIIENVAEVGWEINVYYTFYRGDVQVDEASESFIWFAPGDKIEVSNMGGGNPDRCEMQIDDDF